MSLRKIPTLAIGPQPRGLTTIVPPQAFERWNPALAPTEARGAGKNVIEILDIIGEDFFTGEGVTAKKVRQQLKAFGSSTPPVTVYMNSPGGIVEEGVTIFNMFREYPGEITVKILGMAASMASIVALAGDKIEIAKTGWMMIHNSSTIAVGDRHTMQTAFEWLSLVDDSMREIYASRATVSDAELGAMMDREAYLSSAAVIEMGFADKLLPADQIAEKDKAKASVKAASNRIEALMARAGCSRADRRKLFAELKSGMPGAAEDITPRADVTSLIADLARHPNF